MMILLVKRNPARFNKEDPNGEVRFMSAAAQKHNSIVSYVQPEYYQFSVPDWETGEALFEYLDLPLYTHPEYWKPFPRKEN